MQLYNCTAALQVPYIFYVCQARDSRLLGDFPMARSYGAKARRLNIAAVIIGSILILIFIIIIASA